MTLTDFLLERIAEDEERAAFVKRCVAAGRGPETYEAWRLSWHDEYDLLCIEPERVLAECEAKRRIVEAHPLVTDPSRLVKVWTGPTPGVACENCGGNPVNSSVPLEDIGPCDTLLALALPYADHPDYREEWKP